MKKLLKKKLVNYRSDCRVCGNKNIKKIFSLGKMPLAGNFVKKNELKKKRNKSYAAFTFLRSL